jgi:hypothetical protein
MSPSAAEPQPNRIISKAEKWGQRVSFEEEEVDRQYYTLRRLADALVEESSARSAMFPRK